MRHHRGPDDAGDQQQFVRERVEDGAEFAPLVVTPRDVAVHAIKNRRDRKRQQRHEPVDFIARLDVIKNLHHEKWNQ